MLGSSEIVSATCVASVSQQHFHFLHLLLLFGENGTESSETFIATHPALGPEYRSEVSTYCSRRLLVAYRLTHVNTAPFVVFHRMALKTKKLTFALSILSDLKESGIPVTPVVREFPLDVRTLSHMLHGLVFRGRTSFGFRRPPK